MEKKREETPDKIKDVEMTFDFADIMKRQEGERVEQLDSQAIRDLQDCYDVHNMTTTERVSLLGDLVEKGIFDKQEAIDILYGLVPVSEEEMVEQTEESEHIVRLYGDKGNGIRDYFLCYSRIVEKFEEYGKKNALSSDMMAMRQNYEKFAAILEMMG